jgi:hypothetical protein
MPATVDKVDIQPAISVVVEEHRAGPRAFDDIVQFVVAVTVLERDAGLIRDIDEPRQLRAVRGRRGYRHQENQQTAGCERFHLCSLESRSQIDPTN